MKPYFSLCFPFYHGHWLRLMPVFLLPKILLKLYSYLIFCPLSPCDNWVSEVIHMAYVPFQNNPLSKTVGDCVVRAISLATNQSWDDVYWELCEQGFKMADFGNSNSVWGEYLRDKGFKRYTIPNTCPDCYTVQDFTKEHPIGTFVLGTGTHAVAVINGSYYDAWQSGNEVPVYYYRKES